MKSLSLAAAWSLLAALCAPAVAGEGHDHGDAAPAQAGPAAPRFSAVSESFELVGVLRGRQLTLYLDRSADNSPVTQARIELDIAGTSYPAQPHDDTYEVVLAAEPAPGVLPITATVTADQEIDLLAGELDLHGPAEDHDAAHASPWLRYAAWTAGAMALLALLTAGGLMASRRLAARHTDTGATS